MSSLKFRSTINPFGISYNPTGIARLISGCLEEKSQTPNHVQERDGSFFHPDYHSSFNTSSKKQFIAKVKVTGHMLANDLKSADFLFLTFGTAIAFKWKQTGQIANNCHRMASTEFEKRMLSVDEMTQQMKATLSQIFQINPHIRVILTVSPIRHLRHGAVQNQRSKARLIQLCENLENFFETCSYLPIYELVMDELRDYRFYRQDDLIHLNEGGLNVIKDRFATGMIDSDCFTTIRKIERWQKSMSHRIQKSDSVESQKFQENLLALTAELNEQLPGRFAEELSRLKSSQKDRQSQKKS